MMMMQTIFAFYLQTDWATFGVEALILLLALDVYNAEARNAGDPLPLCHLR